MTYEEALIKVRRCLTDDLLFDNVDEIDEIMQALDLESILNKIKREIRDHAYCINERTEKEGVYFETVEEIIDKYIEKKELEQLPKTIQEKQAESEKYYKAFDDGYDDGYAQARFDYEQQPYENRIKEWLSSFNTESATDCFTAVQRLKAEVEG